MIGPSDSKTVAGALRSAQEWNLGHQMLSFDEMRQRYPQFILKEDEIALLEERAGFVRPERSCETHNQLAEQSGGEMRFGEQFRIWTEAVSVLTAPSMLILSVCGCNANDAPAVRNAFPDFLRAAYTTSLPGGGDGK